MEECPVASARLGSVISLSMVSKLTIQRKYLCISELFDRESEIICHVENLFQLSGLAYVLVLET